VEAAAASKKFSTVVEEIAVQQARGKPIEIWLQDEARVRQKNKITRRWAKRRTRPSAPRDQRTASAYIFGAICPAEGKGAGSSFPVATARPWPCIAWKSRSRSRQEHMRFSARSGRMACLEEAAGSRQITLVPLPPKSPELNPVENIWQSIRENWRIFNSYHDILDHCCFTWNKLIGMPWKTMSIGTRECTYRS
jgi:putative transposase